MSRTIIISNRLPYQIKKEKKKIQLSPSAGGLATGLKSVHKQKDNLWIGWPGLYIEAPKEQEEVTKILLKENLYPVFLTPSEITNFYEGFSNSTLWPLFHYFPRYTEFNHKHWESYCKVNLKFYETIKKHLRKDDTLWIHDYQLLLLPELIRKDFPNITIGFFNHIPFPSYEIFRILPYREELLKGVLGANLIGFHTYDDVTHFLKTVNRILGFDNKLGNIKVNHRMVKVDAFPIGIDFEKFHQKDSSVKLNNNFLQFKKTHQNTKIILSIDRLDYTKGIAERLEALDYFLTRNPEYIQKITFLLVVVPSRDKVKLYKKLKTEIDQLVGRINGKYSSIGWSPIQYFYSSFDFEDLLTLYKISDIALVTPLRDGMNLVCKEFIASKTNRKGVLILSEMAGASKELSDALIVNPYDKEVFSNMLIKAITMPEEEQATTLENLQGLIKKYDIHHWVKVFFDTLYNTKKTGIHLKSILINPTSEKTILHQYRKAKTRKIILDYDGTLVPIESTPEKATPSKTLLKLLSALAKDPRNEIVIISGRDKAFLEHHFRKINLTLIAEHGIWHKRGKKWENLISISNEWKKDIKSMLEQYVDITPGSFIEEKDYSLVWHYRKSDQHLAQERTRDLIENLNYLLMNIPINIMEGRKVIEIKPSDIDKGKALINNYNMDADFILVAGDDVTDEYMFTALPKKSISIKVGNSALNKSTATFYLEKQEELITLLSKLA